MTKNHVGWNAHQRKAILDGGARLRAKRIETGFTAKEFAQRCSLSEGWLWQLENGNNQMNKQTAEKMARVLKLSGREFNAVIGYDILPKVPEPVAGPDECEHEMRQVQSMKAERLDMSPPPVPQPLDQKPPAELPSFDLNMFIRSYEDMKARLTVLDGRIGLLGMSDPSIHADRSTIGKALYVISEMDAQIKQLTRIAREARDKSNGVETLKALRDVCDGEIKKWETT